ncbi:hypothetical protein LWM68_26570 [Niabella sp. W65]|nr:hypothetical protein [Niabella sp. W65]MCH7366020.1 hypothetical protein [Niabella sp. W65]ULT41750.1 hypothetical protein KRR40_45465 [Niabella sp. I65]
MLEETGYEFERFEYLGKTCANPSTNNNWMHMFLARGGKKQLINISMKTRRYM